MTRKKSVLFVSHEATRSGAPIFLRTFLAWFKQNSEIPFEIILRKGGELVGAFERRGPVTLLDNDSKDPRGAVEKLWRHISKPSKGGLIKQLVMHVKQNRDSIGLVYSNTIANGSIVQCLSEIGLPVVCHVHELSNVIDAFGSKNLKQNKRATQYYIACTHAVKENLVENYSIPNECIDVVHEFIALNIEKQRDRKDTSKRIRRQLKLPDDAFVVVGAGTFQNRKGPDIFGQLAGYVCSNSPQVPTHFIWLGEPWDRRLYNNTVGEVAKIGLQSHVHFLGSVANPLDYFAAADAFALMSGKTRSPWSLSKPPPWPRRFCALTSQAVVRSLSKLTQAVCFPI